MSVFEEARYKAVTHILNGLRNAKHRVFIQAVCTVLIQNEKNEMEKSSVNGLDLDDQLAARINPESGILVLNVSQKACPALLIGNGVIMGSVSVNQRQCNFTIPIGSIVIIQDHSTQQSETFSSFISMDLEPQKPQTKKSHLTVVK